MSIRALAQEITRSRVRQTAQVTRLELVRFWGRGGFLLYLLALAPLAIFVAWALSRGVPASVEASGKHAVVYAALYQGFLLRLITFFGCVLVFANAFRREFNDQTLHYSLLSPVRREALVAGKYVAGVLAAGVVFGGMVVLTQILFYLPMGPNLITSQTVLDGLTYVGLTLLAVIGYGALFLTVGLFVRNPIIPAVVVLGWENVNFILPPLLQKISVIHYLQEMSPVAVPESPFAIPAAPTHPLIAVPMLLGLAALALYLGAWKARRLEVLYGAG